MEQYNDVELLDVVRRRRFMEKDKEQLIEEEAINYLEETMKDSMPSIREHLGDGGAQLTLSADLSTTENYCKAGAFCSIKVTCDNSLEALSNVHAIVLPYLKEIVAQDLAEMEAVRSSFIGEQSKVRLPPKPPKEETEPRGNKPNFRR
jgi:hypothetical protein